MPVALLAIVCGLLVVGVTARSERLAQERARFAAAAAHELRTPLAGIQLYGDMLADELGDPAKHKDYAHRISVEAARLGRVVANVMGVSQLERGALAVRPELGDAVGILGMRARRWLNADKAHLERQVETRAPDLVVLNFGGNERVDAGLTKASHKADVEKALAALRAGAPKAACIIVAPIAHGEDKAGKVVLDPALTKIYEAQREVADEEGCAFFDTLDAMGGKKALKTWRDKKLISGDYAHLTSKGHEALGGLIADWLLGRYDTWRKGRS